MTKETTSASQLQPQLFRKSFPSVIGALLPLGWLWTWGSRRWGVLAGNYNQGIEPEAEKLVDGIAFGEGPRFRLATRSLYFADMLGKRIVRYDMDSRKEEVVLEHDDLVSGLGWLPDGRLLVVAMRTRSVLAMDESSKTVSVYADLSEVTRFKVNDMVVSATGHAYVGNFGFDFEQMNDFCTTTLVRVDPSQRVHVEATEMFFPNGSVITPDGKTLIVAETFAVQLTAFDILADGSLANRRVWAYVGVPVDGICLDAEGCVWVAIPQVGLYHTGGALIRVREGGEIVNLYGFGRNGIEQGVFACQLGTDRDGNHHLFFLEAVSSEERVVMQHGMAMAKRNGVLKAIPVPVGPAQMPNNSNYCGGYC